MKGSVEHCKVFLVDWDGTLVDSLPIKISNAGELFQRRLGVDSAKVEASYSRHSGVPRRDLFDLIATDCRGEPLSDPEFESLSAEFTATNRTEIAARAKLRPGSTEALAKLGNNGRRVFISTASAQDEIDHLADAFGVARYCTEVMGSRPGFSKGPIHAGHVRTEYGVTADEMMGIGDDLQDIRLFREAGITAVGITGTRTKSELEDAGADLVIDNLGEIAARVA